MDILNIFRKRNSIKDPLGEEMLLQKINAEILSKGRTQIEVKDNHRLIITAGGQIDSIDGPIVTKATKELLPSVIVSDDTLHCQCLFVNIGAHGKDGSTSFFQISDPLLPASVALSLHWNISYSFLAEQYLQTFNNSQVRLSDIEENIITTINGHIQRTLGNLIKEARIPVLKISHYMLELQECIEQDIRIELYEEYGLYVISLFIDKINYNKNDAFFSLQATMQKRENDSYETERKRDEEAYTFAMNVLQKKQELLRQEAELKLIKANIDAYTQKRELDIKEAEAKKSIYIDRSSTTNIYRTRHIYH